MSAHPLMPGELSALFEPLTTGRVKARVMPGKCYGFVEFATPEEADKKGGTGPSPALQGWMPTTMGASLPLSLAIASMAPLVLNLKGHPGGAAAAAAMLPLVLNLKGHPAGVAAAAAILPLVLNMKGRAGGAAAAAMLSHPALLASAGHPAALLKAHRAAAVAMVAQSGGGQRARAVAAAVTSPLAVAAAAFMGAGYRPQLDYSDL
ncbi:MAG: hypothetical protein WDW38_009223 [Sanguina aurantia]